MVQRRSDRDYRSYELGSLGGKLDMHVSQVKDLCERLQSEICTLRYHAYFIQDVTAFVLERS